MLGNEFLSQALRLEKDYLEWSALYFHSTFYNPSHRLTSLGRDFGKGRSISHFNRLFKILSGCMDVVTSIDGTRLKRQTCVMCFSSKSLLYLSTVIGGRR